MPELPEVEVTRLSFSARIAGAEIREIWFGKPLRWPLGCAPSMLLGQKVLAVRRRGKYLLLDLDRGLLLIHLGMSGSLVFAGELPPRGSHDHFELTTSQGHLRLHDPRRFGAVVFAESEQSPAATKLLGRLGMEPLTEQFDVAQFSRGLKQRRSAVKQVLLAGDLVVGVGNIYACEALFLAGIRPTIRAHRLSVARATMLHQCIREVLARAVQKGGSTLRDFTSATGESGHFQLEAAVYGRVGQACCVCGTPISQIRQGQRSTFFCQSCQRK
ncbi:MAG: bifunctional DNA-formamidopyrimidine glycosylase/DNA-(apurinic or apyrimidinic site) lyase [Burkholderiaceae bacterium]